MTSFRTHARNVFGTAGFQLLEEVSRFPAAMVDMAVSVGTKRRTVAGPSMIAVGRSFREAGTRGRKEAMEVLRSGSSVDEMRKVEARREMNSGIRWLDNFSKGSFRMLGAEDRLIGSYAFRRSMEIARRFVHSIPGALLLNTLPFLQS